MSEDFLDLLDLIRDLRNIQTALKKHDDPLAIASVQHLENAIKTLESYYKSHQGEHEPREGITAEFIEQLAESYEALETQGEVLSHIQQFSQEDNGYIRVREHYRKGRLVREHWRKKRKTRR